MRRNIFEALKNTSLWLMYSYKLHEDPNSADIISLFGGWQLMLNVTVK